VSHDLDNMTAAWRNWCKAHLHQLPLETVPELLVALVVSEREMCAAICDGNAELQYTRAAAEGNDYAAERSKEAHKCADEIRKRNER
jgi:hypothetical protein